MKSVKKNYFYNLIYQIVQVVLPLVLIPYLSKTLMAEGTGKYNFALSLISYFTLFASFGFENYAQREIAKVREDKAKQTKIFWEIILSRCFTVGISLVVNIALVLSGVYGAYTQLLLILSINIVSISLDVGFLFKGNEEFGKIALLNTVTKLLYAGATFLFVKTPNDVPIYAVIQSGSLIVYDLLLLPFIIKKLCKINVKELKPFSHFFPSFKLFVPTIAISLYTVIDSSLLGFITHSDSLNGFYDRAEKIVKVSLSLITCIGAVMTSRNSFEISQGNVDAVKQNIYKSCNFVWLLGLPMMFGLILIADNIVPWFLSEDFLPSRILIKLLCPIIIFIGLSNVFGQQYLIPLKKDIQYTISVFVGAGVNLALSTLLIFLLGVQGAVISTVIAEFSVLVTMYLFVRKDLSIKEILKSAVKPLIASVVMFAGVLPLSILLTPSILHSFIIIITAVAIYAIMILILREPMAMFYLKYYWNKIFHRKKKENE